MKLSPDFRFFCFGAVVSAEGEGRWASALPYGVRTRVSDGEQTSRRYRHCFNIFSLFRLTNKLQVFS
jgi:hypothetical protein